ncbi:F-type conjugal transfer pilus assembly protein TraB [Arsenophonus nasoniae]|uniref:F-type conjugal transfer pilus assembly protein TraB n=1 Tax=Arsenophonus nasoniae TaxID=638 RepID=A0AA95KF76_9GAMM|nr:F-type conjugal transfer pilus assembly protein TraB [Arsenophonus nasoniae]WGM03639.1 F-type conjugal transfer pilus assembly protein TraB [Arsenophonus nasoniae]
MANINLLVKRKQYGWIAVIAIGIVLLLLAGWFLSGLSASKAPVQNAEPPPDLTGVVDAAFDEKVAQHAITQTQAAQIEIMQRFKALEQEITHLKKTQDDDKQRLAELSKENSQLTLQMNTMGQNGAVNNANTPAIASAPEGEPAPGLFPPASPKGQVPPPSAFYSGVGNPPPPQIQTQAIPLPGELMRQTFTSPTTQQSKRYPYIPSGSFVKSMLIEGADANASVTGNQATVPMQVRLTGKVEMPNSKTYDLTGCFVSMEAYGDVSSERAIVRTRKISCIKGDDVIDLPIEGHVNFRGKNGVKGEVVMRNGKILGWAWGAGFIDGLGQGAGRAAQPTVGLGATASLGIDDIAKSAIGGGASKAAQTLSNYYIKRAEQYHPIIPIGAGNEVTVVFQEGFQLKTIEEMQAEAGNRERTDKRTALPGSNLNGFNTDNMLSQLGEFDPRQFINQHQEKGVSP